MSKFPAYIWVRLEKTFFKNLWKVVTTKKKKLSYSHERYTMGGILFLWVWIPLSVLAQNPHKGLMREISQESRRGWGKESPKENKKAESRSEQGSQ